MVPGAAKLMSQLNHISSIEFEEIALPYMETVFEESQRLVPVDKGELKDSGRVEKDPKGAGIVYNSDHATYVEFGTVHMRAQSYLRAAFENMKRRAQEAARDRADELIKRGL